MSAEPQTGATVRLVDVFAEQIKMGAQLAVIQEQLRVSALTDTDHEARLRTLERFRFTLMGAAVMVSAVVSGVGTWAGVILTHH